MPQDTSRTVEKGSSCSCGNSCGPTWSHLCYHLVPLVLSFVVTFGAKVTQRLFRKRKAIWPCREGLEPSTVWTRRHALSHSAVSRCIPVVKPFSFIRSRKLVQITTRKVTDTGDPCDPCDPPFEDCWEGSEARSHQTEGWRPLLKARPPPPPYSIGPYVL